MMRASDAMGGRRMARLTDSGFGGGTSCVRSVTSEAYLTVLTPWKQYNV